MRGSRIGPTSLGWGQLKEQRDSHIQGNSLTNGKSVGIEEKHLELSEESKRAILGHHNQDGQRLEDDVGHLHAAHGQGHHTLAGTAVDEALLQAVHHLSLWTA